jgi:DNA-binding response OmpR family regulator
MAINSSLTASVVRTNINGSLLSPGRGGSLSYSISSGGGSATVDGNGFIHAISTGFVTLQVIAFGDTDYYGSQTSQSIAIFYAPGGVGVGSVDLKLWLRAESIQNEGSTFYISLLTDNIYPNALHADSTEPIQEDTNQEASLEYPQETTLDTGKPILLIVEDNEEIQKYIAESFANSFEVLTAYNGEEGKQQALSRIPDIVVSDIMMPVMDGITLCKQLKDDVRTSHIPIILLTAKDSLQDKEEGYEVGADSYLTKPFSASLLRSRINNLLESRKKLIAQFQTQSVPGNQADLKEKRIVIAEALSKLDNEFIEKITLLIEENLSSEKIDITYLSDKMCMSGSTLYRKMKALTGLSTNEYIRKVKMENADGTF